MKKTTVVIIGGGATGVGILRDLCMRGVAALLIEQRDLAHGTSSRYHGLLHSGGRYAVKDGEAARECIEENRILRKIGRHCVEATEGFFVRTPLDDVAFEEKWLAGCKTAGIPAQAISVQEALRLEPSLSADIQAVYRVPDAAIDGFRLVWQNVASARKYGGQVMTYTEVTRIHHANGQVSGVSVRNTLTGEEECIACDVVVSAAGSWAGKIAALCGLSINVKPDRGTLIAFNHRICSRVVNRLRPPSDGDIFVPHGSITILGTTSSATENPDDTIPLPSEITSLLRIGSALFKEIDEYRILRAFSGTRPLYSPSGGLGRGASRGFVTLDHAEQGLDGFISVVGGKFTTYRLMAEKVTDLVCAKLNVTTRCRTAEEPIVEEIDPALYKRAQKVFPAYSADAAASRLGNEALQRVVARIEAKPHKGQMLCECERVTAAEAEEASLDPTSFTISDIRRKTRLGMGTCQGAFCAYRAAGAAAAVHAPWGEDTKRVLDEFIGARWRGIRPALWGGALREIELIRGIYYATLDINGAIEDENS